MRSDPKHASHVPGAAENRTHAAKIATMRIMKREHMNACGRRHAIYNERALR